MLEPIHLSKTARGRILVDILLNDFIINQVRMIFKVDLFHYNGFKFLFIIKIEINIFTENYKKVFMINKQKT